jgi:hypothetical protein
LSEIAGNNLTGYVRTLDAAGIIHALKHPNITAADILLIPFVVENYYIIGFGNKDNTIVYKKLIDKEYFYVEQIRVGRKNPCETPCLKNWKKRSIY